MIHARRSHKQEITITIKKKVKDTALNIKKDEH